MATIISLKRRIQAARNVSKTTKAMQMISASKMKKAQDATLSTRPYVLELNKLTQSVMRTLDKTYSHPYIRKAKNTGKKKLLIVIAPDKGLCGGLVANLLKKLVNYQKEYGENIKYVAVGKKVQGKVARFSDDIVAAFDFGTITPTFDMVYPIMQLVDEYYLNNKVDQIDVLFTNFTSFFSQTPSIHTLLPINLEEAKGEEVEVKKEDKTPHIFEPGADDILPSLLQHHMEMSIYRFLLESFVSEQASRMVSMQNATQNANDIIDDLMLEYNKTRQAKITSELLDITGGQNVAQN